MFLQSKIWENDIASSAQKLYWKLQKCIKMTVENIEENIGENIEKPSNFSLMFYSMHVFYREKFKIVVFSQKNVLEKDKLRKK